MQGAREIVLGGRHVYGVCGGLLSETVPSCRVKCARTSRGGVLEYLQYNMVTDVRKEARWTGFGYGKVSHPYQQGSVRYVQ